VATLYRQNIVLYRLGLALAIASSACHDDRTLGELVESNLPGPGPGEDAGADTSADLAPPAGGATAGGAPEAGPPEAVAPDAGAPDAGAPDAMAPDAGAFDATAGAGCYSLPTNVLYKVTRGPMAALDFVFDREGALISINAGRVWKTPFSGVPRVFTAARMFGDQSHGTRLLPDGALVVAMGDSVASTGVLVRIEPDGRSRVLASGFETANAIEVDLQGFVYVADMNRKQVVRVDGATGAATVLVNLNGLQFPYGVTFSPDYRTLYIGERNNGNIFALEVNPDGTAGVMRVLARAVGTRLLEGMAVDACGNVYVNGLDRHVYRVAPGGGTPELVADLSDLSMSIANMHWGSGVGGWDPSILYVIDRDQDRVYELDVRVRGKRVAHLP
jgi:sugar lactone lactonase YvrE